MKNCILICLCLLAMFCASAQFQRLYDGSHFERLDDIDFLHEGIVMTGHSVANPATVSGSPHNGIAMYVKDDQTVKWSKKYSIPLFSSHAKAFLNDVHTFRFKQTQVAITGTTSWIPSSNGKTDMIFSILNDQGNPIQSSLIGTQEYDVGLLVKTFEHPKYGNIFIVVGETHPSPNPNPDNWNIIISVLDDSGTLMFSAEYDAPGRQEIKDVEMTEEGGYLLVGETKTYGNTCDKDSIAALILALDNRLNPKWNKVVDITPSGQFSKDQAVGIAIYKDEVWVAGNKKNTTNFKTSPFLMKLDLSGNIMWLKTYDTSPAEAFKQRLLASGAIENLLLTMDGLISLDASGNVNWSRQYKSTNSFLKDLVVSDNGFGICGSNNSSSTITDGYIIRTSNTGKSYSYCENKSSMITANPKYCELEIPIDIIGQLGQKKAELIGEAFPLTEYDCQYNTISLLQPLNEGLIYPNPATNQLTIDTIVELEDVIIFSLDGTLVIRTQPENSTLDISDLPKGTYVLHLIGKDGSVKEYTFRKE